MGSAAADIAGETLLNLIETGMRVAVQERLRRHDHTVCAVSALRSLFSDKRGLYRVMLFACAEPLESSYGSALDLTDRRHARPRRLSVQ